MNAPQETSDMPHFSAFQPGEKAAAVSVFVFAILSTLVLSFILLCVVAVAFSAIFKRTSSRNLSREAFFFRSQLGQYAACLVLSNWIRGVSEWIDIKWIRDDGVRAGSACVAQGSLKLIGQFGSFFFIVAMGIHTFNTLVLRNRPPQWLGIVVTFLGWASALVIGLVPLLVSSRVNGPLYNVLGITGFTCGISKSYQVAHMFLYFLPLFLASFLSAIVYSLIFLMLRGTLAINGGLKIHLGPERRLRPRNETFEEYQRFVYSVARTMLWLPISFVLALCPSSIMQLMDISGITVSPGVMAFSYILEHLDGVINVLILFGVLRALGSAMKSTISTDLEKGRLEQCTVSRPKYHWTPPATFSCPVKEPVVKKAPPAHPPDGIRGSIPRPSSLAKLLLQSHKKTGSANSSTGLLRSQSLSRSPPPSPSFERPSSILVQKPIAPTSVLNAEVDVPPQAIRKHSQTVPRLQLDIPKSVFPPQPDSDSKFTGLTPSPRLRRSRVARDLTTISKSPTTSLVPSSPAPFLEVTLHSPRNTVTGDGVGSLISMYLSRNSSTVELPPFPAAVVQHDSSVDDDLPLTGPHESVCSSLKAAVSIGAVGGKKIHLHSSASHPELLPMPLASPADSTDQSQYSDSEAGYAGSPPPPPPSSQVRPTLQTTQPLRINKAPTSRDRQSTKQSHDPRKLPVFRALPTPPGPPAPLRTPSVRSFASRLAPSASSRSRNWSMSSSLYSSS